MLKLSGLSRRTTGASFGQVTSCGFKLSGQNKSYGSSAHKRYISDELQGRSHSVDAPCVSDSEDNHALTLHKLRCFEVGSRMKLWH